MDLDDYEALYRPTCINVSGQKWERFGYVLIGCSTFIMLFQAIGLGPSVIWKRADDVMTVLFLFELLTRIFEKGYLFFTEDEKNWNLFDSLVVAISIFSMAVAVKAAQDEANAAAAGTSGAPASGGNMNKMKALRTLRLLRLLRLFRVLKGIEKVNQGVDMFLTGIGIVLAGIIVTAAVTALTITFVVALWVGGKAWLRSHTLPSLPEID